MGLKSGRYWIIDDTCCLEKGKHSVGVARQYCGQLGKQDNCPVAVSLSPASVQGSIPIAYPLYLPKDWAADQVRHKTAGVPADIAFATKPETALMKMRQAIAADVLMGVVLADAGYPSAIMRHAPGSEKSALARRRQAKNIAISGINTRKAAHGRIPLFYVDTFFPIRRPQ